MNVGELSGYVASLLVFAAFYMKSMVPLRLIAIASNVAFIVYALHGGLMPVLLLHGALLPLNILRLLQRRRVMADTDEAESEEVSLRRLMQHMKRIEFPAAHILFKTSAPALGTGSIALSSGPSVPVPKSQVSIALSRDPAKPVLAG